MSNISKRLGAAGEDQATSAMRGLGIQQVEKIGTPITRIPVSPALTARGIFKIKYGERVIGDRRGVAPGGLSVLAEVKTTYGRNLIWSDFEDHQIKNLNDHNELDGITLVVNVTVHGVHVLRWPIANFAPGKGITPQQAEDMAVNSMQELLSGRLKKKTRKKSSASPEFSLGRY